MVKNSRERVTSSTPTLHKEEIEKRSSVKFLSGNSRLLIWPEWDDASLANEKWDVQQKGKSDRAARTPGTLFEDTEGLLQLPPSLKAESWRRPSDFLGEKKFSASLLGPKHSGRMSGGMNSSNKAIPPPQSSLNNNSRTPHMRLAQTVVEDPEQTGRLNILLPNQYLFRQSEMIRAIITQISLLYQTEISCPPGLRTDGNVSGGPIDRWKPWHHLYPRSKPPNSFPVHSPSGKYAVKLFWMGCWRKIVVDDQFPFDADGKALLPQCGNDSELWLPILSKAIMKVASLDYDSGYPDREVKETSVIHMLTGWLPEVIDIKSSSDEEIWNMIHSTIPKWAEELPPPENASEQSVASHTPGTGIVANKEPALLFGSYDIKFNGEEPVGVPEIKSEVGGTSFTGSPPPMIWLTETRNTAIPPPKPAPFLVGEPGAQLKPTEALYQLRQQRQQRIKHELLLKQLAGTSPRLIHASSAFSNFEEVLGDYVPDMTPFQALKSGQKKKDGDKKEPKKKDAPKPKKDGAEKDIKGDKKKEDKKKSSDEKSEKAEKKKDKNKKTPEVQPELSTEIETVEDHVQADEDVSTVSPLLSFWVEFGQFFKAFNKLYVFHKPADYTCHRSVSDMRNISPSTMVTQTGGRRTAAGQAVSSATYLRGIPAPSPLPASGTVPQHTHSNVQGQPGEDQPPLIMCIDSTKSIEMLINLTSLSLWHGAPLIQTPTLGPIFTADSKLGLTPTEVIEHNSNPEHEHQIIVPGRLELSKYLWSDIQANIDTLITVNTSGTSCYRVTLAPGLHTLRLNVAAPYAWHADFISNTPFVIADTESFVNHVNRESLRYQATALYVVKLVRDNINNFEDPEAVSRVFEEIACADKTRTTDKIFPNLKTFIDSLFYMIETSVGDQLTTKHKEAWTAFSTMIVRAYKKGCGDSLLGIFENDPVPFRKYTADDVFEQPAELTGEITETDQAAAKTIQKHFRGHHVRKRTKVLQKGNKINLSTKQLLQESWAKLEGNELQHGLTILSKMFRTDPSLLEQYSFYEDKKRCAYYVDYHGSHGDIPARNWFLMFKEVFTAPVPTLVKVSVSANMPGLLVRVLNNDTGKEMPKIGQKPKPCLFQPNKTGYTVMCEGKTYDGPLTAGKYRIRLVGSTPDLLVPARDISTTGVMANEIKEYYLQDKHCVMFRHVVHVSADTQTTVQVSTSKSDVNFKLEIFDGEEQLSVQEGIGHIVIPSITFFCDEDKVGSAKGRRTPVKSRVKSGTKSPGRTKVSPALPAEQLDSATPRKKSHHYIIQGTVLRNTWDNNNSPWQRIIDEVLPKDEPGSDRPMSGSVTEEKPSTPNKKRSVKEEKVDPKKAAKAGIKAVSPAFDESKPYWVMRVYSDSGADEIVLKRDTQRQDEIRSIKAAWEELQPGRAAKAKAIREKYLVKKAEEAAKMAKKEETKLTDEPVVTQESSDEIPDTVEEPIRTPSFVEQITSEVICRPDSPKFYEIPAAFQSFVKQCNTEPELFDEAEHARFVETHKEKVNGFHEERRSVLSARDEDRAKRNELKEELLSTAESMQVEVDATRDDVCALRESLRQRMIAEEQARQASLEPEQLQSSPSPKPTSAKKPKSPKGAKKKK